MKPANISGFHMGLGQPVYLGSLFLGCEFPAADTRIEDATARTRYYSGKPFSRLKKTQGVFLSWPAVLGVARSDDKEVLQSDFFAISRQSRRRQNSASSIIPGTIIC